MQIYPDDPYDLARFVRAQQDSYEDALSELENGLKQSHWMWFVFPQFNGLGASSTSRLYSIKSIAEATAFLGHAVLGPRLLGCCEALRRLEGRSAHEIFGAMDAQKLKSCATLFDYVSPSTRVFGRLLAKYFSGVRDARTLEMLGAP